MITEGQKAEGFVLRDQDGTMVSLSDYAGKRVVLYFYPKDDTPGCTVEGMEFSRLKEEFSNHNTVVLGISKDTVESHKDFCNKHELSIRLLSDGSGDVLGAYDALREQKDNGKKSAGIVRSTVFIDENGTVRRHWKGVQPEGHARNVLEFIASL